MKKVLAGLLIGLLLFIGYLLIVTFTSTAQQIEVDPIERIDIPDSAYLFYHRLIMEGGRMQNLTK